MTGRTLPRWVFSWLNRRFPHTTSVRRRPIILSGPEALEDRTLPSSTPGMADFSALQSSLAQFRNDMTTSAVTLVNAGQPSPMSAPTLASVESQWSKAWNTLTTDWNKTWQAFLQVEDAALGALEQEFKTLLDDLGIQLPGQTSPTSPASNLSLGQTNQAPSPSSEPSNGGVPPPVRPAVAPADPPSQTTLTSSVSDSSSVNTATFTLTATVTGNSGTPTGSVTFYSGTLVLGTATLNSSGVATFTTLPSTLGGSFDFSAIYTGNSTYSDSTGSQVYLGYSGTGSLSLTGGLTETDSLTDDGVINGNNICGWIFGHTSGGGPINAAYTGTISGNSVSGTFNGKWNESPFVHGTMSGSVTGTESGTTLNMNYSGTYSGKYSGNVNATTKSTIASPSSIALTSSLNPATYNQSVTFTATVSGNNGMPTGSVTFYDNTTALKTVSLNASGVATDTTSTLPTGYQDITAIYSSSNSTYAGSTAWLLQYINPLAWQGPTFSWTQTWPTNPSVTAPASQTNTEGDNVSLQVQASGGTLSYDAVDLPPGLSINSSTGLISGTVAYGAAEDFGGSYNPTVIVANSQGGSAQASFSWTINQAQVAPTIDPPNQTNLRGDTVSLQVNASQVDSDPLTYTATNLPPGLSIDPNTGLISGTVDPTATLGVPYAVTVTATDDVTNLSGKQNFNWTINATNVAPVLTSPGNQTNAAGDVVSLQLSATDADGDNLTYTASGLPPGLTLDPIAGTITGTLPNSAASSTPYNVTVTASDGSASNSQSLTWTVNVVSLQNPGDQSNLDGDSVSLQLTASDAKNNTLTYSASDLPSGLSINSSTGLISGNLGNTDDTSSPYSVTVTAKDSANYSASQTFNWTVARLALNPVNNQENQEGTSVSLQLSATDHAGTPTYSATGLPSGLSINSTTGLISGTIGVGSFGSSPYQVTVTATDGSHTSSQSLVWTVTPRVALVNPGPQSDATGDSVSLQLSATSPGGTKTYSATGLPGGLSINSSTGLISGTLPSSDASSTPYTVAVTANDGTSHSSQTFAWTVSAINLVSPVNQTNNDGDAVSLSQTTGYHGSGTLSYSATGLPTGLSISSSTGKISGTISGTADTGSPYSVTVTATDGTNAASQTFTWTVNAVVSITSISDQSNADGDAVSLQVSASDSLNKTLTYSATHLPTGLSIASTTGLISGTISAGADANSPYAVTVTATDSAGNSATQNFNWTVTPVGLVNPGPQASVDGKAVSVQLHGSSGATYTATGLPSGVGINSSTGLISGTLASNADASSPYVITATATLGSHSISQTFVLTVTPVGLAAVNTQTNTEGDTVSLQLQGLSSGGTLTYSASDLPNGLSLSSTNGLITGTVAAGDAANGPYTVDAAVSNGTVSGSQTFTWNVNPVVNLTAPADQSNKEGDNVSLQISATDSKHTTLTYSATGLPVGLSISSSTGLISGSISSGDAANGPYAVTVTASDGTYSSSVTFTWNVTHTDTTALTMTNPGTQTNVAGDSINLQINASDPDGIDTLTYSATGLPDGVNIDPYSGLISGTMADDAVNNTPYTVTVTADDGNGQTINQTFTWLVNAPVVVDPPLPISAVEGQDTGSITLATFTTADLNSQAGDFTATINWGDGSSDQGTVSGSNGSFTVTDDHTYAEKGSDTVTITVTDNITGYSSTDTTTATVTDAALTLTGGFQLGAIQNQSSVLTLATFTDGNPNASLSDYTATINWGDGSGTQAATVSAMGEGVFAVGGSHTYSQNGTDTVTITVTDVDGSTATATSTVVVGQLYAGIQSNLTVASFTDTNTSAPASSFTATINWGDGNQSNGTVTGGSGTYQIQGTHTYAQDSNGGTYPVTVTVSDSSGDTLTASSTVAVVRPPMSGLGNDFEGQPGTALNNVQVAAFTEPDAADGASEFSASIDWGDGSTSNGTVQEVGPGLFAVLGTHTFAAASSTPVVVSISQGWQAEMKALVVEAPKKVGNLPNVMLYSLSFDNGIPLQNDQDFINYSPDQWLDKNLNGKIDAGDQQYPYAYVSGSQLEFTAVFMPQPGFKAPAQIKVKANIHGSALAFFIKDVGPFTLNLVDGKYTLGLTNVMTLPKVTEGVPHLMISWEYFNGNTWVPAGKSDNKVYLTYQAMTGRGDQFVSKKLQTVFQDACFDLLTDFPDSGPPAVLVNQIFRPFQNLKETRALDSKALSYYKDWTTKNLYYYDLVQKLDGQCTTWAGLFAAALLANGLDGLPGWKISLDTIFPDAPYSVFLVKNWKFTKGMEVQNTNYFKPAAGGARGFPFVKTNSYEWIGDPEAIAHDPSGIPGQNVTNPASIFGNHCIVEVDTPAGVTLYDPSYGKSYQAAGRDAALKQLQDASIAGFGGFIAVDANKSKLAILPNNGFGLLLAVRRQIVL